MKHVAIKVMFGTYVQSAEGPETTRILLVSVPGASEAFQCVQTFPGIGNQLCPVRGSLSIPIRWLDGSMALAPGLFCQFLLMRYSGSADSTSVPFGQESALLMASRSCVPGSCFGVIHPMRISFILYRCPAFWRQPSGTEALPESQPPCLSRTDYLVLCCDTS